MSNCSLKIIAGPSELIERRTEGGRGGRMPQPRSSFESNLEPWAWVTPLDNGLLSTQTRTQSDTETHAHIFNTEAFCLKNCCCFCCTIFGSYYYIVPPSSCSPASSAISDFHFLGCLFLSVWLDTLCVRVCVCVFIYLPCHLYLACTIWLRTITKPNFSCEILVTLVYPSCGCIMRESRGGIKLGNVMIIL